MQILITCSILETILQSLRTVLQYMSLPSNLQYMSHNWSEGSDCNSISSPHFTAFAELEVFCVELVLYWSIWFITGCASVNTVRDDRRGGLPGNGAIDRGFASGEGYTSLNPPEAHSLGKMLHKERAKQTPPEMCVYDKLPFVHSDVSASGLVGKCGVKGASCGVVTFTDDMSWWIPSIANHLNNLKPFKQS